MGNLSISCSLFALHLLTLPFHIGNINEKGKVTRLCRRKKCSDRKETMTFSDKLFKLRTDKGLSQNELAKNAGLSQTAIYYLEKGKRQAKFETIIRIAEALDTDFLI